MTMNFKTISNKLAP